MKAETTVIQIVAKHARLPISEIHADTALIWNLMNEINDDVCFALLANINTMDALACKTVGQYVSLVESKLH